MSTDAHQHEDKPEPVPHHSAFDEWRRDERSTAVLLLSALIIAATFFAIGIIFGRWTATNQTQGSNNARPAML
ncbi:MAG: hypothetical protein WBP93_13215, partial [Pyrinomonadaceae bacterium]